MLPKISRRQMLSSNFLSFTRKDERGRREREEKKEGGSKIPSFVSPALFMLVWVFPRIAWRLALPDQSVCLVDYVVLFFVQQLPSLGNTVSRWCGASSLASLVSALTSPTGANHILYIFCYY